MANKLIAGAAGAVRNSTTDLKTASLVETDSENEPTRLAPVRVRIYDGLALVLDRERVAPDEEAELASMAAEGTESAYQATNASIQRSGNAGYKVQLPNIEDGGFQPGESVRAASRQSAPGVICLYDDRQWEVVDAVLTVREEQV